MEGKTLGPYRIESELGSGGMGKVWLATKDAHRYALKVVHPHLLESPGFFKRFLREAEIGKAVTHPNVVRCFDCDQLIVDGTTHAFLVMEYVEGQTLRDLLDELESVPEELCRHIGREASKGLAAIHAAGVVHRDLKPENVLITPDHEVKVMDLGVARLADEAMRLSLSGAFVGTPLYASPEHFKSAGEDLDGRADLFSLGVILYELACGVHPHPGDDFASVLANVREKRPRRLGERNPQLSAFFEEVVHSLLGKKREERFVSGAKLLEVLEQGEQSTWWGQRARTLRAETKRPLRRIRIPRETAVYGREEELGKLKALYEKAKDGEGQVVLIEGEAGIGKTRLVDELIGRLQQDGEDLNFLFGSYPPGGAATASGAWSTAYREQFGTEGLEETLNDYLTVTPVMVPAFAALLRGEPPPEGQEVLTKDSIQAVFAHATRALAAERTTVVLIEDLHFAPEEGRAMFASLALASPEDRLLLVGTARPGLSEVWRANLERLPQASRLDLSRLGPKNLAHLLKDAFQSERLAHELGMKIAEKSDGNPFFVFEIIRGLREGQIITKRPDGTWMSTGVIQDIRIPSSVQDLIQARIADLTEEEQGLLDVAACLGFEFDPGIVAAATGVPRIPALKGFSHLEKSHRLVRSEGRNFVFDHHQVQETLYAAVPEQLREEYHCAIGDALLGLYPDPDGATAVDICEHSLKGSNLDAASRYIEAALEHLEKGYVNDQAIDLANRSLATAGLLQGRERAEVLMRKARVLNLVGQSAEERAALDEALVLADVVQDPALQSSVRILLGRHLVLSWESAAAREVLEDSIALARETGDKTAEAKATGNLGIVAKFEGQYELAQATFQKALELSREAGYGQGEAFATMSLGLLRSLQSRHSEARSLLERAGALYSDSRQGQAAARANLGVVLMQEGAFREAREMLESALALSRQIGDRAGEAASSGNLGIVHLRLGCLEQARTCHENHHLLARAIGNRHGQAIAKNNLGCISEVRGCWREARSDFEKCLALSQEIEDRRLEADALGNLAGILFNLGCIEDAREGFATALDLSRSVENRPREVACLTSLAQIAAAEGAFEAARQLMEESLSLQRELRDQDGTAESLAELGALEAGNGEAESAIVHLGEALDLAREVGESSTVVLASIELALLSHGTPGEARRALAESEESLDHGTRMRAHFGLWSLTGEGAHLSDAHRLLCHLRDHAPEECRESMITNVPLHRDIMAAWEEHRGAG